MTNEFSSILEGKSLADLRAIAKQMGISGCDKMRKAQIIAAITGDQEPVVQETEPVVEVPAVAEVTPVEEPVKAPKVKTSKPKTTKSKAKVEPATEEVQETPVVVVEPVVENTVEATAELEVKAEEPVKVPAKRGRKPKVQKVEEPAEQVVETPAEIVETTVEVVEVDQTVEVVETPAAEAAPITKGRRAYSRRKTPKAEVEVELKVEVAEVTEISEATEVVSEEVSEVVEEVKPEPIPDDDIQGVLEIMADGYGFLRTKNYFSGSEDIYVSPSQIKRFGLRPGDQITGKARKPSRGEKFRALSFIELLNGDDYATMDRRPRFENLTPIYPDNKLHLETLDANNRSKEIASRLLDIMAPIGRGQRGLIVSPPKAGKTELLKKIAHGITTNHPDVHLIVLLIDERPEEVTDMQRSIKGEIVYSTFDEEPEHHVKAAEMVMEHAKRMVEQGKDVVVLMDSLTRLTRAYNLTITNSGRTMSGGMDTAALIKPKKFLGAARNIEFGGSLTIIATALVDTGSKMDDLIYEEFKGTGNLEIHLDRKLSERRIFPAIDIYKSGTRRDDLLLSQAEKEAADKIRRAFTSMGIAECTEMVINQMMRTPNNSSFLMTIKA